MVRAHEKHIPKIIIKRLLPDEKSNNSPLAYQAAAAN